MISEIKAFLGGYRAVKIKSTIGMEGRGFSATLVKDGQVLGEIADYADGGPVNYYNLSKEHEDALISYAKLKYPEVEFGPHDCFIGALIDYEESVKKMLSRAKKQLLSTGSPEPSDLDSNGISVEYSIWNVEPTDANRALILRKYPNVKFLNDELKEWEVIDVKRLRK